MSIEDAEKIFYEISMICKPYLDEDRTLEILLAMEKAYSASLAAYAIQTDISVEKLQAMSLIRIMTLCKEWLKLIKKE
jgi:hypothetical protein